MIIRKTNKIVCEPSAYGDLNQTLQDATKNINLNWINELCYNKLQRTKPLYGANSFIPTGITYAYKKKILYAYFTETWFIMFYTKNIVSKLYIDFWKKKLKEGQKT